MSDVAILPDRRSLPNGLVLMVIPLVFTLVGLAIRYFGYVSAIAGASPADFLVDMCRWDCRYYVGIAEQGYHPFPTPGLSAGGNWAFFPLFPLLVGAVRSATGFDTLAIAAVLSIAACIGAARAAWPLLGRNLMAYTLVSAFLLAGPFSVWFVNFYTEALFISLTVGVFAALKNRRFLLAGCIAGLLSATRIVGVLIVFAIAIDMWRAHREAGGTWRDFVPSTLRRPELLLAIFVAPLGLFAYALFLHLHIGDGLAFLHVQRAWARPSGLPPVFVWNALLDDNQQGWWPTPPQVLATATLVGYAMCLVMLVRRQYAMAAYALMCLTVPLFAGMASMLRFTAALAPVALTLNRLLAARGWLFAIALLALLAGGYFATIGWLGGYLALV